MVTLLTLKQEVRGSNPGAAPPTLEPISPVPRHQVAKMRQGSQKGCCTRKPSTRDDKKKLDRTVSSSYSSSLLRFSATASFRQEAAHPSRDPFPPHLSDSLLSRRRRRGRWRRGRRRWREDTREKAERRAEWESWRKKWRMELGLGIWLKFSLSDNQLL